MKVVILCGGQGTRIRGVSDQLPKPMIPLGEYPILWHIMKRYASAGMTEFILCLGHKGHVIKEFFLNYQAMTNDFTISLGQRDGITYHNTHEESDWRVTLADTGQEAMTGARVQRIRKYIGDDPEFMLTYGDGVSDIDLAALLAFHHRHGRIVTVSGVRPPSRFGEIECTGDGLVTEFNEKPQASGGLISGGFFVCRRELFDYLDDSPDLILEQGPMRRLVRDGQMMIYHHQGFWQCMDTYRDYTYLNQLWEEARAPWKAW